jgi:anthranilate phosphoribosyltransferase
MIKEAINILVSGNDLSFLEASRVMEDIMNGEATPAQIGAFAAALRMKGESVDEIAGLASVMRAKATPVKLSAPAIDIVGTGGDGSGSFNISTAAALVAAGAGLRVAKHGNRAASSTCGSADILEALGVKIDLGPEAVAECVETVGIGFMFAQIFHPAMKNAAVPRREIGIRTVFNILGPLTNPARAEYMVLGVPGEALGGKMAAVLCRLGTQHSLVVHGRDGLDEISISGPSLVWEVKDKQVAPPREVKPEDCGLKRADAARLKGGTALENAGKLRRVLDGEKGALRDVVVINAAAALVAAEKAQDMKSAARLAEEAIDSGRAREKLVRLVETSQRLK